MPKKAVVLGAWALVAGGIFATASSLELALTGTR